MFRDRDARITFLLQTRDSRLGSMAVRGQTRRGAFLERFLLATRKDPLLMARADVHIDRSSPTETKLSGASHEEGNTGAILDERTTRRRGRRRRRRKEGGEPSRVSTGKSVPRDILLSELLLPSESERDAITGRGATCVTHVGSRGGLSPRSSRDTPHSKT